MTSEQTRKTVERFILSAAHSLDAQSPKALNVAKAPIDMQDATERGIVGGITHADMNAELLCQAGPEARAKAVDDATEGR